MTALRDFVVRTRFAAAGSWDSEVDFGWAAAECGDAGEAQGFLGPTGHLLAIEDLSVLAFIQRGVSGWYSLPMRLSVELGREVDGRWIADVTDLPGVQVYGLTREAALSDAQALALRVLADRLEHGEALPEPS